MGLLCCATKKLQGPCPCMHLSEGLLCLSTAAAHSNADSHPPWLRPVWPFLELAWGMQVSELLRKHGELALGYITQVCSS